MKKFNIYFRAIMYTVGFALIYFIMHTVLIDTMNECYWFVPPIMSAVFAFIFFGMFLITVILHFYIVKLRLNLEELMQERKSLEECITRVEEKVTKLEKNNGIAGEIISQ